MTEEATFTYKTLQADGITRRLFSSFVRRQTVTTCRRKIDGAWRIVDDPFVDDWTETEYRTLIADLRHTAESGGLVLGAFASERLVGFASVEAAPIGTRGQYRDLTSLHVSADLRGRGVGAALFRSACRWAAEQGAEALYLSAHSAVETQAFYRAMGCVEAEEYSSAHVEQEPCDCQMECALGIYSSPLIRFFAASTVSPSLVK